MAAKREPKRAPTHTELVYRPGPPKQPFGRPIEYRPELCALLDNAKVTQGGINCIAQILEVPKRTVYDWMQRYPDFSHSVQNAIERADAAIESAQLVNATVNMREIMQIWLGKQRLGQRDRIDVDVEQRSLTVIIHKSDGKVGDAQVVLYSGDATHQLPVGDAESPEESDI